MGPLDILIKDLEGSGKCLPKFERAEDAGLDLYSAEDRIISAHDTGLIPLGIATAFPRNYVILFRDRSSMAGLGLTVMGGVIDSGYRGEWKVMLYNTTSKEIRLCRYQKVIQAIILLRAHLQIDVVKTLPDSDRGDGGFGSTGK